MDGAERCDTAGVSQFAQRRVAALRALNRAGIRLLHLLDLAVIYVTLFAITWVQMRLRPAFNAQPHLDRYLWSYGIVALIHLGVFSFGGLYERERRIRVGNATARIVMLVWFASLVVGLVSWLMGEYVIPRSVLVAYAVIGPLTLWLTRRASRRLRWRTEGDARLLLVGTPESVDRTAQHFGDARHVVVAGHVPDVARLEADVAAAGATDVLLTDGDLLGDLYTDALSRLESQGVDTFQIVRPQDTLLGLRTVGEIGGVPIVSLAAHVLSPSQQRLKRAIDLLVVVLTAPVTLPLTGLVALLVLVRAGRPLLFIQNRVGRDGATFPMYKFRTMRTDAEVAGRPVQAAVGVDPRVVRGLGWLRATRMDELPQLWNALLGHMTMVGPRPERPEELLAYEAAIPGYRRRHQISPGITGLAQVYGRYHTDIEYKLGYDLLYLANWSPVLELQILLRTLWVILARRV